MEIKDFVFNCSKQKISEKRRDLLTIINGDMFYSISLWPRDIKRLFWNKPISDKDTFKLLIFFVENGSPPWLAEEWILTSTFWDKTKVKTRQNQIRWILANLKNKRRSWFYFDLHLNKYVYLDGSDRHVTRDS